MIKLHSTLDCQLCEAVEDRLQAAGIPYQYIDISENDTLIDAYGWFIPVIEWGDQIYKSPLKLDELIPQIIAAQSAQ